jgi:hypothetical protein
VFEATKQAEKVTIIPVIAPSKQHNPGQGRGTSNKCHKLVMIFVSKIGLPDEPLIVLDILKSGTTEHIVAITQPLRSNERSRKTHDLTGRERLLKKLNAEEIIQTLYMDDSLKNVTEIFRVLTGTDIEGKNPRAL